MKIIILFISIFAFQLSNAQEFKIEDKTLIGIFEVKEKQKHKYLLQLTNGFL